MKNKVAIVRIIALIVVGITMLACGPGSVVQGSDSGTQEFAINDPVLQMRAWTLTLPASWKAEGTMLPGSSCNSATTPVYRASSPDGHTGAYLLPRSDWGWGPAARPGNDCLGFRQVVSAKDFLTYLIRILDVGFVREEPVPELAAMQRQSEAMNQQSRGLMRTSVDMAKFVVRYSVNGQPTEELITTTVSCSDTNVLAVGRQYSCAAFVSRWFTPLGKLQATMPTFKAMTLTLNKPWMDQWSAVTTGRIRARSQQQTSTMLAQGRLAQAQRMQQHQDFMASFQKGRDIRNQQFQEGQYQKQKNKEDYVDHILDCQRLSDGQHRVAVGNCANRETQ